MLPLVDRPLIQYAVDEARAAGIEEFTFVTAAGKGALEDYFDTAAALEHLLAQSGKTDALATLRCTHLPEGALSFVRQNNPLGLSQAVRLTQRLVGDEPYAVSLPDDVIRAPQGALSQMVDAHRITGGHMVATMEVPRAKTSSYGVLDVSEEHGRIAYALSLVEKPQPEHAPSTNAIIGRYILEPSIFNRLANLGPGAGGKLQLTDAINADLSDVGVTEYRFDGERFDCGSVQGFVQAIAAFALDRPELRAELRAFLQERVGPLRRVA
jgi:UTP--glucose-1-phosphate uridylyltransferase